MNEFSVANKKLWDELTEIHKESDYYDLEGFKAGDSSLYKVEEEELVDVAGKTMLHLQCHFGMDTMTWARKGAFPTGVDFSPKAIKLAIAINDELGLKCKFIESDIYTLPEKLERKFDIVYTSYGVLAWLQDIKGWAKTIGHFLKPGGTFYMVEIHPFTNILDDSEMDVPEIKVNYSYFHEDAPMVFETDGSYADGEAKLGNKKQFEWHHSMGDIFNALIGSGLEIEYLHEFDFTTFQQVASLVKKGRYYSMPKSMPQIPLLFSLRARKKLIIR